MTIQTDPIQYRAAGENGGKFPLQSLWNRQLVKLIVLEINNTSTFQTMHVVMIVDIGIEASGPLVRFGKREKSDVRECR